MSPPNVLLLPEDDTQNPTLQSFESFLSFNAFAPSTVIVYTAMFRKFIAWLHLERHGKSFRNCAWNDIEDFVNTLGDRRLPLRYTVLIRDIFDFLRDKEGYAGANPASELLANTRVASENDARHFLDLAQRDALMQRIENAAGSGPSCNENELRDTAIVGVLLGCGLRVPALRSLTVNCVTNGMDRLLMDQACYEAPMLPFARGIIEAWALTRAGEERLFPELHHASVFRLVVKFLVNAGIAAARDSRMGPQTLRNTYGAMLIDKGYNDAQLKMALGLNRLQSAALLRSDYAAFCAGNGKARRPKRASSGKAEN